MDVSVSAFEELSIAEYPQVSAQTHQLNHCIGVLVLRELKAANLSIFWTHFMHFRYPVVVFPVLNKCKDSAYEYKVDDHND